MPIEDDLGHPIFDLLVFQGIRQHLLINQDPMRLLRISASGARNTKSQYTQDEAFVLVHLAPKA